MNLHDAHYPNLEQNKSGFYWKPPPAARAVLTSSPLGKDLSADAMANYHRRQQALAQWRLEQKGMASGVKPIGLDTSDALFGDYQR